MALPGVSIVIITYNEEKNIGDCLDSIMKLDYPKNRLEVIVVDSSSDHTPEIVRKYPVRFFRSEKRSFSIARNFGIKKSRYDLIAFTDADCIVPKSWLKILVQRMQNSGKEVAGVGGNAYPPENSTHLGKNIAALGFPAGGSIGLDAQVNKLKRGVSAIVTCNALFRKSVLEEVGRFDENLKYAGEDSALSKKIREEHYILEYEPDSFVYHKARSTLSEFIGWCFKIGQGEYFLKRPSLLKLIFTPFSLFWLMVLFALELFIITKYSFFIGILFFIFVWILFVVSLFKTKKFSLLFERRNRIGIDYPSLFLIVPFLFYLRRIILNFSQLKVRFCGT